MANASGFRGQKQTNGYFVPLANCVASIFQYNGASGAGGSFLPGAFTRADWSTPGNAASAGALLSSISTIGQGGLLKDMGRTVVSSNRTFRKVQLVAPTATGVSGTATTNGMYFTGYIELGTGNAGAAYANVAPVAYMPGLI
jgi:hypothetical protein